MDSKDNKNKTETSDDKQVWKNSNLIKAVSGILTEIINENKKDPNISNSKILI